MEEVQERTARTASAVARAVADRELPGDLKQLTKPQLLELAAAQRVKVSSSMTKQQLLRSISSKRARAGKGGA